MNRIEIKPVSEVVNSWESARQIPMRHDKQPSSDPSRDFRLVPLVIYYKHPEIHHVREGRSGN
jgi:hypothetical protein